MVGNVWDSSIKLILTAEPQQLINSNIAHTNYDVIDGLTYKFDLTQLTNTIAKKVSWLADASRVRDNYQGKPIDLNQTFLVVTNNIVRLVASPVLKDAAEKRLLNLENRQAIIDYIVSENN